MVILLSPRRESQEVCQPAASTTRPTG